jgi:hypothetical protein
MTTEVNEGDSFSHIERLNTKNFTALELSDILVLMERPQPSGKEDSFGKRYREFMERHEERTIRNLNRLEDIIKHTA